MVLLLDYLQRERTPPRLLHTTMVLHWLHVMMTSGILLLLLDTRQVSGQQQPQTEANTGSVDVMASDGLSDVIIVIIVAVCVGLLLAAVLGIACYFHYKRSRLGEMRLETGDGLPQQYKSTHPTVQVTSMEMTEDVKSENSTPRHDVTDTDHRPSPIVLNKWKDFKTLLEELKPQAETILVMLNDVRRRVKEAKHGNPRIDGYKAVCRDLSRVLFLLNKKEDKIKMPPDGVELLTWAQQIVNKYNECQKIKKQRESSQSFDTPPEMSAVLWIQSKDDSAFDDEDHEESHVI